MNNLIRIPNDADNLHCLQACFVMLWATLTGEHFSMLNAEEYTGFRPGVETWPYAMIAWLAEHGCEVVHIEALDAVSFVSSPREELVRIGAPLETSDYYLEITDIEAERDRISRALSTRHATFDVRVPEIADIRKGLTGGWVPLLAVDYGTLEGHSKGIEGHMVMVTASTANSLVIQDPGPPVHWDWALSDERIISALRYPAESSGAVTLVRQIS